MHVCNHHKIETEALYLDHGAAIVVIELVDDLGPALGIRHHAALALIPDEHGEAAGMGVVQQSLFVGRP